MLEERVTTDVYPSDFARMPDWEAPDERIDKWYHNMDSVKEAGVAATTFQLEFDEEAFSRAATDDWRRHEGNTFLFGRASSTRMTLCVARPEFELREVDIDGVCLRRPMTSKGMIFQSGSWMDGDDQVFDYEEIRTRRA